MFELIEKLAPNAVIKVIGVGGGGGNAVAHMLNANHRRRGIHRRQYRRAGDEDLRLAHARCNSAPA